MGTKTQKEEQKTVRNGFIYKHYMDDRSKEISDTTLIMKQLMALSIVLLTITLFLHLKFDFDFAVSIMTNCITECFAWFVTLLVLMSFLEHQIHCNLMHKKNFLSKYFLAVKKTFEHHAILHHGHYSRIFTDDVVAPGQDRGIRLNMTEGFIEALPISALIAIVSLPGAIIFEIVVCLHHFIWNIIHLEMHKPENRFFSQWPIYKFLARHHYLHHRYPDKNFNVVLPLADYILGTNTRPNKSDLEGMHRAGLI
jgi:hypothetical protein